MLEKITFEAALGLLKKTWPYLVMAILAGMLALSQHNLGNARKELKNQDEFRTAMQGVLKAKNNTTAHLLYAAGFRMEESEGRRQALVLISTQALSAKQRSEAADAALKDAQAINARKFAAAQAEIASLKSRKSTGNRDADWQIIEKDTQAPWKGWKK